MATFYADLAPLTETVRTRLDATLRNGDIRYAEATYVATGTEAASGDSINVVVLPVGAQVIPELSTVAQEASLGGSVVAIPTIGDSTDVDRYSATSISLHSSNAGSTAVTPAIATSVIPRFTITTDTRTVVAAITRTNALTAGKKILFRIAYKLGS
jgi:hypothetical protein